MRLYLDWLPPYLFPSMEGSGEVAYQVRLPGEFIIFGAQIFSTNHAIQQCPFIPVSLKLLQCDIAGDIFYMLTASHFGTKLPSTGKQPRRIFYYCVPKEKRSQARLK